MPARHSESIIHQISVPTPCKLRVTVYQIDKRALSHSVLPVILLMGLHAVQSLRILVHDWFHIR